MADIREQGRVQNVFAGVRQAEPPPTADSPVFVKPDWSAPLDLEKRIERIPARATVRGLFFNDLLTQFPDARPHAQRDRFLTFKSYPFTEWSQLLAAAASACFPKCTPRE